MRQQNAQSAKESAGTAPVDCRRRFSPEELLGLSEDAQKTRKKTLPKAPPKYQFDENGETKYWSGRGRTPKPIDEALKAGRSLDEFLIKKDASSTAGDEQ
nr:H-NS family nucleoid-associated regulatory protein [Klebsiella pneumoniae]